ncbi:hypothetical protein PanWU01x14_024560 [Parasponia andersonii]|uniref:Uncharacterized protein n=1 Tax=Parasponia andersonii TaxID=3476 RepID=A0A2P5DWP5_PARAD|nr:hypothetical protein PanWU01x14_024560 [Parasponia andersonii]
MAGNLIFSTPIHANNTSGSYASSSFCEFHLPHHMDDLTLSGLKEFFKAREHHAKDFNTVTLDFGHVYGVNPKTRNQIHY